MKLASKLKKATEDFYNVTGVEPVMNIGQNPLINNGEKKKKADDEIEEALSLIPDLDEAEKSDFPKEKRLQNLTTLKKKYSDEIVDLAKDIMIHIEDKHTAKKDNKHSLASQIEDKQLALQRKKDQKYIQQLSVKRQISKLRKEKKEFLNKGK